MERPNSIYVSYPVMKALRLLAKSGKCDRKDKVTGEIIKANADLIADAWLYERLKTNYPQIFEHDKQIEIMEKELLKTL